MTYPNSSLDHQSEQTPDCWDELTAEERETWQSLTHDERRAFPPSCALDVIRRALANRRTSTKSASGTEQDQAKERPINPAVPSAVIQTTAQALDQAEEIAGILSELARLCWRVNHREECPQELDPHAFRARPVAPRGPSRGPRPSRPAIERASRNFSPNR